MIRGVLFNPIASVSSFKHGDKNDELRQCMWPRTCHKVTPQKKKKIKTSIFQLFYGLQFPDLERMSIIISFLILL